MARRRMFSLDVVDTDEFYDLPNTAKLLYYQFGMFADDDGFVKNPKKIIRDIDVTGDDLEELIKSGFVIRFESGVIVIRHWHRSNEIKSDRYKQTLFFQEKCMLSLVNGVYDIADTSTDTNCIQTVSNMDTNCIQTVSDVDTQVSLGKERLTQVSPGQSMLVQVSGSPGEGVGGPKTDDGAGTTVYKNAISDLTTNVDTVFTRKTGEDRQRLIARLKKECAGLLSPDYISTILGNTSTSLDVALERLRSYVEDNVLRSC